MPWPCRSLILLLLVFTLPVSLHALLRSGVGTVSGTVKDSAGAVLPHAQIQLQPGNTAVASDSQGDYVISDVTPGTYTITVTSVGFGNFTAPVTVVAGQTATIDAVLAVSSKNQKVTVHGVLSGSALALQEQRTSPNILNVMTAQQIQALPNASIATVLGRMPGVTVQINEGEAQYVQIRGTEPRLSNTTLDGVLVPGPDPQVRQVDLWVIPADLVGAVQINKTLSANQDGDAIGGSVNMQMRQATSSRPTLDLESLGGWNPIDTGQQWIKDDATVGKRFGANQKFGVMFSYSYDLNDIGTDDVEPVPTLPPDGSSTPYFNEIAIQQYFYNHTRYGFGGSADYKPNPDSDFFVHGLFSNFKDYGQKYTYDIVAATPDPTQPDGTDDDGGITYSTSVRRPNYQISLLTLGGNQVFQRSWVRWVLSVGHSREGGAAGNPGADFAPIDSSVGSNCLYTPGPSIYRPQFPCPSNDPIYDASQYGLQDINLTTGQATQLNLTAAGSYGLNYHLGTHSSALEFGAQVRNVHKGQFANSPTYDCNGVDSNGNPIPCGTLPLMTLFTTSFTDPSYYGGSYQMGPVTNFDKITNWLAANPGVLPYDSGATHLNSDSANYNLQERITAGYVMNTVELGSRIHLQTGLRIEATNESNTGYIVTNDANGNYVSTTPIHASGSYVDLLPSVQFRYSLDQNSDVRAVYGRGISRPDPYDLVPYVTYDTSVAPNTKSIGNPALLAEHAEDFDLLYEKFLPFVGVIQGGYFYKYLTDPLLPETTQVTNTIPNGNTPTMYLNQTVNAGHAYVQGIELAYQQHLTFLPGVLSGARIDANMTWTDSKAYGIQFRTDTPPLIGQAPFSYNITPSYVTKRATVSVGISYDGPNLAAYQWQNVGDNITPGPVNGPNGDNYYFPRTQIDAQVSYYLGKGFTFLVADENANNAPLGFYNGGKQYMTQREYYKPIYYGGLRWTPHWLR